MRPTVLLLACGLGMLLSSCVKEESVSQSSSQTVTVHSTPTDYRNAVLGNYGGQLRHVHSVSSSVTLDTTFAANVTVGTNATVAHDLYIYTIVQIPATLDSATYTLQTSYLDPHGATTGGFHLHTNVDSLQFYHSNTIGSTVDEYYFTGTK